LADTFADEQVGERLRQINTAAIRPDVSAYVLTTVADVYHCSVADIQSGSRAFRLARFTAASLMYARALCDFSLYDIGRILRPQAQLDHKTISYYINSAEADERYYQAAFTIALHIGADTHEIERLPQRTGHKRRCGGPSC
jgi:chromosomal replication initiation ATPase DnaA